MNTRRETLEVVRLKLAAAVSLLTGMHCDPTGPYSIDLEVAADLIAIMKRLHPEHSASHQLEIADEELGWWGTSDGRIDRIKKLKESEKLLKEEIFKQATADMQLLPPEQPNPCMAPDEEPF